MIDAEQYVAKLWTQSFAADPFDETLWVAPGIDVDLLENLPALTWYLGDTGEQQNGPNAFDYVLSVNVFGDGMDAAKAAAMHVDAVVMKWFDDPFPTRIEVDDEVIVVSDGGRRSLLTRLSAAEVDGRHLVQYSGSYGLLLRH